jgi:hypothetical protein
VDEVIDALGEVVDDAYRREDRAGLFAALYRRTTIAVRDAIRGGRFDDPQRMARLDVVFAHRYFDAYRAHRAGAEPSAPWRYAFARAREDGHLILQHLLLGVNAHIALDLALAACATTPPGRLAALEHDFFVINDVLAEMVDEVQDDLGEVSPRLRAFDRLGGPVDERLAAHLLGRARRVAWRKARRFDVTPDGARPAMVARWERQVTKASRRVCPPADRPGGPPAGRPGGPHAAVLGWIGAAESDDVRAVLDAIRAPRDASA